MNSDNNTDERSFLARALPPLYNLAQWFCASIITFPMTMVAIWFCKITFYIKSVPDPFFTLIFSLLLLFNINLLSKFKESCFLFVTFLLMLLVVSPSSFLYLKYNYGLLIISQEGKSNIDEERNYYKAKTHKEKLLYVNDSNR